MVDATALQGELSVQFVAVDPTNSNPLLWSQVWASGVAASSFAACSSVLSLSVVLSSSAAQPLIHRRSSPRVHERASSGPASVQVPVSTASM
jgi:hypothetical protein